MQVFCLWVFWVLPGYLNSASWQHAVSQELCHPSVFSCWWLAIRHVKYPSPSVSNVYFRGTPASSGILLFQQQVNDSHHLARRQSTTKNSGHCCKTYSKQPSMGIMSRESSRGGFPLPSSRFLLSSVLLLDSSIIDTSMQGSCQRQPCCHRAVMVVQERCCAFEL